MERRRGRGRYNGPMSSQPHKSLSGTIYVSLTLLGWASAPLFLKYFTKFIDAWTANGWRYGIAAVFWTPLLIAAVVKKKAPARLWYLALLPTFFNVVGQVLYARAPYYIEPGFFAFLLRSQILFVTLGAWLLFANERGVLRSPIYWAGVGVVLLGSVGTVAFGPGWPRGTTGTGVILSVVSGAFFAGYGLAVRRNMHGVNPMIAFAIISQQTALVLIGLMWKFGKGHGGVALDLNAQQWLLLVASSFIGIGIAHVFYYAAIARLGVAISGGVILLMPFITAVGSFLLYHEKLKFGQWLCGTGALVGAAMMLATQSRFSHAAHSTHPADTVDDVVVEPQGDLAATGPAS